MFRRIAAWAGCGLLVLFIGYNGATAALRERLFTGYMKQLDDWVNAGGKPETIEVVGNVCGKLVLTQAGWFERIELVTFYRDEFDFRVDVCAKMTANRLYKQPEFERPDLVRMICYDTAPYHAWFGRMCKHDGLRPTQ